MSWGDWLGWFGRLFCWLDGEGLNIRVGGGGGACGLTADGKSGPGEREEHAPVAVLSGLMISAIITVTHLLELYCNISFDSGQDAF